MDGNAPRKEEGACDLGWTRREEDGDLRRLGFDHLINEGDYDAKHSRRRLDHLNEVGKW